MSKKTTERHLNLFVFLLDSSRGKTRREIQENIHGYGKDTDEETFRRMLERDKESLREFGITIDCTSNNLYKISKDKAFLPEINLSSEEIAILNLLRHVDISAVNPFKKSFKTALLKFAFDSPDVVTSEEEMEYPLIFDFGKTEEKIETLINGVTDHKTITFEYEGINDEKPNKRTLDPYGIICIEQNWLIVGRCHVRDDIRCFNVKRMSSEIAVNNKMPKTPDFTTPPDFKIASIVKQPWEWGSEKETIILSCDKNIFPVIASQMRKKPYILNNTSKSKILFSVNVRDTDNLLKWILRNRCLCEIINPKYLKDKLSKHLLEIKQLYGKKGSQ